MSPEILNSHIYDVGEPPRLIQHNATLDHTNTIGVHSHDWNILLGYCNTTTKRVMGLGGLHSYIYDVSESSQIHHTERDMIPCSTERQGFMVAKGIINGSLMLT